PVSWFPRIAAMVERIDRLDTIRRTIETVRERAIISRSFAPLPPVPSSQRFLKGVHLAIAAGRQKVDMRRTAVSGLNLAILPQLTLAQAQTQAKAIATLGDLITG